TWFLGVMIVGGRLLLGWFGLMHLRRQVDPVPEWIQDQVERLSGQLKITAPMIRLTYRVSEAVVFGVLRPMILLPAAWSTELPADMIEAVILHELAHLQRRDLWVNLLQRLVEMLLFYHPAVWSLSNRLRIEREF